MRWYRLTRDRWALIPWSGRGLDKVHQNNPALIKRITPVLWSLSQ
ncbi:hypothetical protein [Paenibacillus polymyxa]|nr:hypothetical protein [Paenibacillus polymyxa]